MRAQSRLTTTRRIERFRLRGRANVRLRREQLDHALHRARGALHLAPHLAQRRRGGRDEHRIKQKLPELAGAHAAGDHEHDKVKALDAGADDYLTKPFGTSELLARMRVALRHALREIQGNENPIFTNGALRVDLAHRQVFVEDNEVHLTPLEYKLLLMLVKYAGKVVTGKQLLRDVWGPAYTNEMHYIRVYMAQLRHKLEKDPTRPRYLITEPGVGYRLKME